MALLIAFATDPQELALAVDVFAWVTGPPLPGLPTRIETLMFDGDCWLDIAVGVAPSLASAPPVLPAVAVADEEFV